MKTVLIRLLIVIVAGLSVSDRLLSQTTPAAESLVDFQKHVQPILEQHCLKCHGPEEDKGGFRVDEMDSLKGYIEAGSADQSSLWSDYLYTKDPDSLMPPATGTTPAGLSTGDLLIIRTWINDGATGQWQASANAVPEKPKSTIPESDIGKLWAFQGLFHPAATHLPVALLAVSAMFIVFSFFNREACEPVAFHCLWIGALGAVAACMTGWSYAVYEGYGVDFTFDLQRRAIDRHRWLGVFVAVFSLLMVPLARSVRKTADVNKKVLWFFGSLIMLGAVSVVGFQGGELTYGEGHYGNYYKQLFGGTKAAAESDTAKSKTASKESVESKSSTSTPASTPTATPQQDQPATEN